MARLAPLPIDHRLPEIVETLSGAGALVLIAEPGAGKTTRVPPALLSAVKGEIWVLEPRRLAARLSAMRVAEELGERVGETAGYEVRFDSSRSKATRLVFMTEALLVKKLKADPDLSKVSAIVFDEFHERSVHADIGLSLICSLRARRPDLLLLVMSATLDAPKLAEFIGAETISVEGRVFPVELSYEEKLSDARLEVKVRTAIARLIREGVTGDLLVFLPGALEIERAIAASDHYSDRYELAMLHGEQRPEDQQRVLAEGSKPKIIFATNIAETSLTLPRVRAVIDSGLQRIARFSPYSGLPELATVNISRASAEQRRGRAGRVAEGRCHRLYTAYEYQGFERFDRPEILRTDLAESCLGLLALGHDPERFDYLDVPPAQQLKHARELLERLGAQRDGVITPLGRELAELPIPPRLARLLVFAESEGVGHRGALLAALLSERELRRSFSALERRFEEIAAGSSDLISRLEAFEAARAEGFSGSALRYLDLDRRRTFTVDQIFKRLLRARRLPDEPEASLRDEEERLLRALLIAFPDRVARRIERGVLRMERGRARLDERSEVREAEFLVVIEGREGPGGFRISAASSIEPEWLLEYFPERIHERRVVRFDEGREVFERSTSLLYDELIIDESVSQDLGDDEASEAFAEFILRRGAGAFFDADAIESFAARMDFAERQGAEFSLDEPALLREAIRAASYGKRSLRDLKNVDLIDYLRAALPYDELVRLDQLAPEATSIPGRKRVTIFYPRGGAPYIESRMQDFFGALEGPSIADGRVKILLHLLAPNGRAVQITGDLAGFWERHYPSIRRELMRRYPRHPFPEDPRTAEPGRPRRRS